MNSEEWFRIRAKELYHEEGEIEVDSNARVSIGEEEGAYVAAWVWVPSSAAHNHAQPQTGPMKHDSSE
jgi:hypothetical protein